MPPEVADWQAFEALTGSHQMDATAIVDYVAPLKAWLDEQIKGEARRLTSAAIQPTTVAP